MNFKVDFEMWIWNSKVESELAFQKISCEFQIRLWILNLKFKFESWIRIRSSTNLVWMSSSTLKFEFEIFLLQNFHVSIDNHHFMYYNFNFIKFKNYGIYNLAIFTFYKLLNLAKSKNYKNCIIRESNPGRLLGRQ